jgi:hypothetical protein
MSRSIDVKEGQIFRTERDRRSGVGEIDAFGFTFP